MFEVKIPSHVMLTIKRPDGSIEVVKYSNATEISSGLFDKIKAATKKAGKGDVLSYENIKKDAAYTMTAADLATDNSEKIEKMMSFGE
jgi:hypothetical protein